MLVSHCTLCWNDVETIDHLLWSCEYARQVWTELAPQLCVPELQASSSLLEVTNFILLRFQQQHTSQGLQHRAPLVE